MPKLTIDGIEYDARPGQTVIQVIYENKLDLPHFCWHPALTVAGNCRMCLVEVEKMPKLAIACGTTVSEGMIVHTNSENAVKGREDVMEFLLINHPLDCPICDEAGQCKLQDYAFNHSRGESRFEEEKVHKDKRVPFGPNVLFDGERCISCSRCIRFGEEIAEQPVLTFVERGDHVTISPFPGTELDNPYSMNVIDICPVGALTSRDFRFKARSWDMSFTETVCPSCSRGCSMRVGVRDNEIMRLEPRPNPNVNDFWMCDVGRLKSYPYVNADDRVSGGFIRSNGKLEPASIGDAAREIGKALYRFKPEEILFVASAFATLEDNYIFLETAKTKGAKHVVYFPHVEGVDEKLLIRADKTPNARGIGLLGIKAVTEDDLKQIANGKIKAIYSLEDDFLADSNIASICGKIEFFACHAGNMTATASRADIILPAATWAEKEGVFVNFDGWVQKLTPAVETKHHVRGFEQMSKSRLDKFGSKFDRWAQGRKVDCMESWRLAHLVSHELGRKTDYRYTEDVFERLVSALPDLEGMSYDSLESVGQSLKSLNREPKQFTYREVYQVDTAPEVI